MRAAVSLSLCVLQLVFAVSGSSSFNKNWLHGFIDCIATQYYTTDCTQYYIGVNQ